VNRIASQLSQARFSAAGATQRATAAQRLADDAIEEVSVLQEKARASQERYDQLRFSAARASQDDATDSGRELHDHDGQSKDKALVQQARAVRDNAKAALQMGQSKAKKAAQAADAARKEAEDEQSTLHKFGIMAESKQKHIEELAQQIDTAKAGAKSAVNGPDAMVKEALAADRRDPYAPSAAASGKAGVPMSATDRKVLSESVRPNRQCLEIDVAGAGTPAANGRYIAVGEIKNGGLQFVKKPSNGESPVLLAKCKSDRWIIGDQAAGSCAAVAKAQPIDYYSAKLSTDNGNQVPHDGWDAIRSGLAPAPKVTCIAWTTDVARKIFADNSCALAAVLYKKCPAANGCLTDGHGRCRAASAVKAKLATQSESVQIADAKETRSVLVDSTKANSNTIVSALPEQAKEVSSTPVDYNSETRRSQAAASKASGGGGAYVIEDASGTN
jgi:hypothetical protein